MNAGENVAKDVAKLFGQGGEEISLALLDDEAKEDKNKYNAGIIDSRKMPDSLESGIISLGILENPADPGRDENYISTGILEKPASLMCEHLSARVLECNVGGFAHFQCSVPAFHEKCPAKELHRKMQERRF